MSETAKAKEKSRLERVKWIKIKATFQRDSAMSRIRKIHAQSLWVLDKPGEISKFLVAAADLDKLWTQFELEDNSVLDCLITLNASSNYSSKLPTEIRGLVTASQNVVNCITLRSLPLKVQFLLL